MIVKSFKPCVLTFCGIILFAMLSSATANIDEQQIQVGLRMIGHEILLSAGDKTSRVLPIEKEEGRYKILFSSDFAFDPGNLVKTVTQVVEKTNITGGYIVEVEDCESKEVVYGYKMGHTSHTDLIPCAGRIMPKACYQLFVTILDSNAVETSLLNPSNTSASATPMPTENSTSSYLIALLFVTPFLLIGSILHFRKKKSSSPMDPDLITIGDYQFNKRNMTLSHQDASIELTSKEADLLFLLYNSSNKTLERENILNVVWGDDGDYTGRTLDVFISKLRKKLVADSSLKIVNIRGVGYKFVVNQ